MNIRNLPIGKIVTIVVVLALVIGAAAELIHEYHEQLDDALSSTSSTMRSFSYDGEIYVYNYITNYNYFTDFKFLRKLGDTENYTLLPGYTLDWSDSIGKFVYSDGKKIKTCDINAENTETLHKFSDEHTVVLSSLIDKYAIISGVMRHSTGHVPIGLTYLLNIETGDTIKTGMRTKVLNAPLAISENYLYYFACYITEPRNDLCRCDITTGKCETLISEITDEIEWTYGCIIDDYLYFSYNPNYSKKGIARYSLSTGELETSNPGVNIKYLSEYKGKLLTVYYTRTEGDEKLICHVCTYDFDSQELEEIGSKILSGDSSIAVDFRVYDGLMTASATGQAYTVELSY